jgi:hypothetical protein
MPLACISPDPPQSSPSEQVTEPSWWSISVPLRAAMPAMHNFTAFPGVSLIVPSGAGRRGLTPVQRRHVCATAGTLDWLQGRMNHRRGSRCEHRRIR